ncbi:TonB-dependent receptor [Flavobacterium sp. GCM10027622]|uniref:TonB-dependent receptor n=1 Tax=unclassified Flavobacterium TaxID=196869 RepID=UPI00360643AD
MKLIIKLSFVFLFVQFAQSQSVISGNLRDGSDGNSLSDVYVFIPELNKAVVTDDSGNYSIQVKAKGEFTLQFSLLGYQSILKVVQLNTENLTLDVLLKRNTIELNPVVISNSFLNEFNQNTYKVDVVTKDDIQKVGGFSVMDVLNKIPGVDAITTGTQVTRPVIRGLSSNRVLTLLNGVRFETQQWDDEHGIGLNENGIERIEVIKGPESLLYGPEAMGGIVNFIKTKPAPVGSTRGSALTVMSTNNLGWRALANVDGAKEKYNWGFSALGKLFSDYFIENQSFRVPNTRLLEYGAKGYIGVDRKWGSTNLEYTFNQAFFGILDGKDIVFTPDGDIINTDIEKEKYPFEIEAPFHTVVDNRVVSTSTFLTGKSKFEVLLSYQNNHRTENEELSGVKKGYKYVDMTLQSLTYSAKWFGPKWGRFSSVFGMQGMHQNNKNGANAATVLIPDAAINDLGFFALSKYDYGKLNFTLGARYDSRKLNTDETNGLNYSIPELSKSYDNVSTSIGVAYNVVSNLTLRTSFATGYRSPNLNELTSNGYKLESRRFEVGNPNFEKEHNNQFDFSSVYDTKSITFETSFFVNRVNNFIYIAPTGNMVPNNTNPSENVPEYKFHQANAELLGGEARLDIHPAKLKWFRIETKYAVLNGKNTDNDSYLPMMTPTKLSNTVYFNFNDFGKFTKSYFSINLASTFDQNQVDANELKTKGYNLINLGLFTTHKTTDFTLTANNLLDKQYVNHMSRFRQFNISEPGLNIAISVKKKF